MRRPSGYFGPACFLGLGVVACSGDTVEPTAVVARSTAAITTASADPAIAYGAQTGSGFKVKYFVGVMNADGSNQTLLTPSSNAPHPAWSPDARSIAYHPDTYGISRIDVSLVNGKPQASAPVSLPISHPAFDIAWSPDPSNDQIAYSWSAPVVGDRSGLSLAPSKPVTPYVETLVYQTPLNQRMVWITWNPQATRIAFLQRSTGAPVDSLFILDLTTASSPTRTFVRAFQRGVFGLSWSRTPPDRLALQYPTNTSGSTSQPAVLDLATNTLSNVPSGGTAKWSPDDSRLVFVTMANSGLNTIGVVTLSTGARTNLADGVEPEWRRNP
jgi:Tol biopolymer transport system component